MNMKARIRAVNMRLRRGSKSQALRSLMNDANYLDVLTPTGYISSSKSVMEDPDFIRALDIYEYKNIEEKQYGNLFPMKERINSLVHLDVDDSDLYQTMRNSYNQRDFVDSVKELIALHNKNYSNFTKEDMELIDRYLVKAYGLKRLPSDVDYRGD